MPTNLPPAFAERMKGVLGDEYDSFCRALQEPAAVSLRPNQGKGTACRDSLRRVPWSSCGRYLDQRPAFTFDPLFHAGGYYVQEASSMAIEQAVSQCHPISCALDLCAAPGGKSTLLRSLMAGDALLVANEPVAQRAQILAENIIKWGHPNCVVTNEYPQAFTGLSHFFDFILVDAPCSGEGMFRKDNPALELWSESLVDQCAERQREILAAIWPALRPGGHLLYSTCTYNMQENEDMVSYCIGELGAEAVPVPMDANWRVTGDLSGRGLPVCHFMPHRTEGEGFFMALLRKPANEPLSRRKTRPAKLRRLSAKDEWGRHIMQPESYVLWQNGDTATALPLDTADRIVALAAQLRTLHAGLPLATVKGRKQIPHHALAMSLALRPAAMPAANLDKDTALDYLRRLAITLPPATPRGHVLVCYKGLPLGFANNLGAHANNCYPAEWRIRSPHTPDESHDYIISAAVKSDC